ncbi:MAG: glutathionylspermidine synthase family protein [Blastocatellia bacterium]
MPALPDYGEFARMLYGTCIISDPWLNGAERFRLQGMVLTSEQADALRTAAERIGWLYHELAEIVFQHPHLLDDFLQLTPFQKAMWLASEGRWHGIARVDLFLCSDGRIRSCEMNSDTPSGEAEAVLLNELLHPYHPGTTDPNTEFAERFWQMLVMQCGDVAPASAAIIYPTDLPEDLSMIAIYRQWLEERGCRVVIGSPYNLGLDAGGRVTVFERPVELIVRHYKTDWWGERETIWTNQQEFADAEPLARELLLLLEAESAGRVTVVNPFGAVVTQNKLSLALMWEHRELFSAQAQQWIAEYIPETRRLSSLDAATLRREEWVLKSDYGCEGDSVVVGPFVKPTDWAMALAAAIPRHWVAQRYFEVAPIDNDLLPNVGVYLIGGQAAGFYTRLSRRATDYSAVTAPTFISS